MAINYSDTIPEEIRSGIGFLLTCLKSALTYTLPVVTPVLIASIVSKYRYEISQLQLQYDSEKKAITKDLLKILKQEENEEQVYLANLKSVQQGITEVLDFRCSKVNPFKNHNKRMEIEDSVFLQSSSEFHRGLRQIFTYDHQHCGTNASNNGQLWRVWIETWKAQAEAKKYRNVVEKLKEKLKE